MPGLKIFCYSYYYLENKVTVIILHIILVFKTTQQFSNNVSCSYQIEENLANDQHYTYLAKASKLALQTLRMPMPKMSHK